MLAANRVGKTEGVGAYETTLHLTGRYPGWWEGKRFTRAVSAVAAGETAKSTRNSIQKKLLGRPTEFGSGMIPRHLLINTRSKAGIPDAVEIVYVKHVSGGTSTLILKSYDQGIEAFASTEEDVIWEDEEPPIGIHSENVIRTMTTGGIVMLTFTPLNGYTATVQSFLEPEEGAHKFFVQATWDDAPHLTQADKEELWNSTPPFMRDARARGIPSKGAGSVYPVLESEIVVPRFKIPEHWKRSYGLDVGWNRTAAIWGARDPESHVYYLYDEHYQAREEPSIHAASIRARGAWVQGAIDPAARGRSQVDGRQLLQSYIDLGLHLTPALNQVEAPLAEIWNALSAGQLKVMDHLINWLKEFRLYRRDEKGNIIKQQDHLMDAMRYWWNTGRNLMLTEPRPVKKAVLMPSNVANPSSWMT